MLAFAKRFTNDRSGATAVEYALIAAFVVLVIVSAVGALGTQLSTLYNQVTAAFPT
ncbi:Flp family type IVb pilin [Phenylobacterium sp.]|uniref:Flp family type IVb pilin n=1 Tax=Phenylobacterium sp. TaxID=1871053 RepID=UPI0012148145|nr:Flp family type IVb pilin [Phenylobacterium sp.]THD61786.1 MAG: Flp family type IVb pilin [Phenylobacterium sp.]